MTKIQGGFNDPEFFEEAPNEGLLVGMEVGIGRFFDNPVVHAVRPIFRTGAVDTVGQWHGPTVGKEMQRIVAKPGYAVGAITVKNGLTIDGILITFMRVTPTGLDPGDSYDSPWIGGMGGGPAVKLGDGLAVVGLIGKVKADSVTGLGLLYREQVIVDAPANPPARPEPEPTPTIPATPQVIPAPPPLSPAPPPTKPKTDTLPRQALESPKQAIVDSNSGAEPSDKSSRTTLIVVVVGVVLLGAGALLVGGIILMKQKSGARADNQDDDDEDDDDRQRRRGTSESGPSGRPWYLDG